MTRPNFLLFITDQHRADHLGAYGNTVVHTPNLDGLARRGWVADRCYVSSPVCMPNRASLLTGRPPSLHGVRHNGIPLSLQATTFVDVLRRAGWRTALIGKGHLQNMSGLPSAWPPAQRRLALEARREPPGRYDQEWGPRWQQDPGCEMELPFYGFDGVRLAIDHGDEVLGHYRRWLEREHPAVAALTGPGHALASDYALVAAGQAWRTRVPEECSTTRWIADETILRLQEHARDGEPFFIQCSFPDPHHPFTPPGRYWDMYDPALIDLPASFHGCTEPPPHVAALHRLRDAGKAVKSSPAAFACSEREAREAIALNYGSIAHIDAEVGRVLGTLQRLGLDRDTVVIFTSDHGDYLGDHQLLLKTPIHYQSLIRAPLIWSDPQRPTASRSADLHATIDLAPSILQRAGVPAFNGITGRCLPCVADADADADAPLRRRVVVEDEVQRMLFGFAAPPRLRTLVTPRWRMSVYLDATWGELYDLQDDPHECRNRWDDPGCVGLKSELLFELAQELMAQGECSPYASALA